MPEPTLSAHHATVQMKAICQELLDLPVLPIQVEWTPRDEIGATGDAQFVPGDEWGDSVQVRVATDLSPREAAATVAHELKHIDQGLKKSSVFFWTDDHEERLEEDADAFEKQALRLYEEEFGPLDT